MLLSEQETRPEEMLFPTKAGTKGEEWREAGGGLGVEEASWTHPPELLLLIPQLAWCFH